MTNDLNVEAVKLIDEAVFVGQIDSNKRFEAIRMATKGQKEFNLVQSTLVLGRKRLIDEFDKYARGESLEVLRKTHNEYFRMLYRAKFLKEPK